MENKILKVICQVCEGQGVLNLGNSKIEVCTNCGGKNQVDSSNAIEGKGYINVLFQLQQDSCDNCDRGYIYYVIENEFKLFNFIDLKKVKKVKEVCSKCLGTSFKLKPFYIEKCRVCNEEGKVYFYGKNYFGYSFRKSKFCEIKNCEKGYLYLILDELFDGNFYKKLSYEVLT